MTQLSSPSITQLFTVPQATWMSINTRVRFILYVNVLNNTSNGNFLVPWPDQNTWQSLQNICNDTQLFFGIRANNTNNVPSPDGTIYTFSEWIIGTNTPTLLAECQAWSATTLNSLISLSSQISVYAQQSILAFQQLNNSIKASPNTMTPAIQIETTNALTQLANGTQTLVNSTKNLFVVMQAFLAANQAFDDYLTKNSFLLSLLNIEQLEPDSFNSFESSMQAVLGAWDAISSDLNAVVTTPSSVTSAFLESLNIAAAISDWTNIQAEAASFSTFATGLSQQ